MKAGVYMLQMVRTAELAKDQAYEFFFGLGQPRLQGTVQTIVNAIAIRQMLRSHSFWRTNTILLAWCVACIASCASQTNSPQAESLTQQFEQWFVGNYSNAGQRDVEPFDADIQRYPKTDLYVQKVDLPAFGDMAYYAEWQNTDDNYAVMRQRIYTLEPTDTGVRLNLFIFPGNSDFKTKTSGAHLQPERLGGVTPKDMVPLPGCDLFFERTAQGFAGAMRRQSCAFPAPETGEPIYSWTQMSLDPNAFSYLDGWFRQSDDSVYRRRYGHWARFERLD